MFIQFNDDWALTSDEHCWKIQKYSKPTDKCPDGLWVSKYYCTEFKSVVRRLARLSIRLNNATTMDELVKHAETVHGKLSRLLDYEKESDVL